MKSTSNTSLAGLLAAAASFGVFAPTARVRADGTAQQSRCGRIRRRVKVSDPASHHYARYCKREAKRRKKAAR